MATGFPAAQTHLKTRLEEIRLAVEDGAMEIDVVINRTLVLTGQWEGRCLSLPKRETQFFPGGSDGGDLVRGSIFWKSLNPDSKSLDQRVNPGENISHCMSFLDLFEWVGE